MTTIACDGKILAADSQRNAGSECIDRATQKIVVEHGYVYALTGNCACFGPARKWHAEGADPAKVPTAPKDGCWTLLVFSRDKVTTYHNDLPYPSDLTYPQAFGSGGSYALGALKGNLGATQALEIAIDLDIHSGEPIRSFVLEDLLREAEAQRKALEQPPVTHVVMTDGKQFVRVPISNGTSAATLTQG